MHIRQLIDGLTVLLGLLGGVLLFYLVLGIGLDVTLRWATGKGIPSISEYSDIVLVALIYFSLARTQRDGGHVTSDLLFMRLPPRLSFSLELTGLLLVLLFLAGVTWYTADLAWESFQRGEYRLGLSGVLIWPARWVIVVGLIAWQLQLYARVADLVTALRRGRDDTRQADSIDVAL